MWLFTRGYPPAFPVFLETHLGLHCLGTSKVDTPTLPNLGDVRNRFEQESTLSEDKQSRQWWTPEISRNSEVKTLVIFLWSFCCLGRSLANIKLRDHHGTIIWVSDRVPKTPLAYYHLPFPIKIIFLGIPWYTFSDALIYTLRNQINQFFGSKHCLINDVLLWSSSINIINLGDRNVTNSNHDSPHLYHISTFFPATWAMHGVSAARVAVASADLVSVRMVMVKWLETKRIFSPRVPRLKRGMSRLRVSWMMDDGWW